MKIYTKTGDSGETGLFGGRRVKKSEPRVEAYGGVDELNASLGWAGSLLGHFSLEGEMREIQSDLFVLGADLATAPDAPGSAPVGEDRVKRLEGLIDGWEAGVAPLKNFILPGGSPGAAALQICRAVCRRAERSVVALGENAVRPEILRYLNRLSDWLFVTARFVNHRERHTEMLW